MNPANPIRREGESGWEEKPIAYLVLQATDPSVDHLPAVRMELSFDDTSGPVVLPVESNTVPVDASESGDRMRATGGVLAELTLDARPLTQPTPNEKETRKVTFEVIASAAGVVPDLEVLLPGFEKSLPGWSIAEDGIESEPLEAGIQHLHAYEQSLREYDEEPAEPEDQNSAYIEPDEDGFYRLERRRPGG